MEASLIVILLCIISLITEAQTGKTKEDKQQQKPQVVEASCGECKLGLPVKPCDLIVRINSKAYFVDGTNINSHGDAHAQDGFCQSIKKAEVKGEIVDGRFKADYFKLLADRNKKRKSE